jgi:glutamate N-acetyltransferase/amino-acid N-acetyltransferase
VAALQGQTVLPAAQAIMTTDLYPKVRRADLGEGTIVGFAKGAGMVEPNLATMLVYLLTDLRVSREELRAALAEAVEASFNRISIDSDTSTSDTVVLLSSGRRAGVELGRFREALRAVCRDLAGDVVRNGEGVRHVMRVRVAGAADAAAARGVGKAVVNSPLVKTAVAGNDPNVGRLLAAIGKHAGERGLPLDPERLRLRLGGETLFEGGAMRLDPAKEERLVAHLRGAQLYASRPTPEGIFKPPVDWPRHERCVELEVDLGLGGGAAEVLGADLTHEYVTENADYRS